MMCNARNSVRAPPAQLSPPAQHRIGLSILPVLASCFVLLAAAPLADAQSTTCPCEYRRTVLLDFAAATTLNGSSPWAVMWDTAAPVCSWLGVTCIGGAINDITQLTVMGNSLVGTLPKSLAALTNLQRLELGGNAIAGTLPPEYAAWTQLVWFNISFNQIGGPLPPEYKSWSLITDFLAQTNRLSGELPVNYTTWVALLQFDLGFNRGIRGTLPEAFGPAWTALKYINLRENYISGSLPDSYAAWKNMYFFGLAYNQINGTLPHQFSAWTTMRILQLDVNRLTGSLPTQYASWTMLNVFNVDGNRLNGSLPTEYKAWTVVQNVNVANNSFSGPLPPEYASWTAVQFFDASRNNFSGTLPDVYNAWTSILTFRVAANRFEGTLPAAYSAWRAVDSIDVSRNRFNGTFPSVYQNWTAIQFCRVHFNQLSGTLPSALGNHWGTLVFLSILSNQFSGTLHSAWGTSMRNVATLLMSANRFSGSLPLTFANMPKLVIFTVDGNDLHGELPSEWGSMRVQMMSLQDNPRLVGPFPSSWSAMFPSPKSLFTVCNTSLCGFALQVGLPVLVCFPPGAIDPEYVSDPAALLRISTSSVSQACRTLAPVPPSEAPNRVTATRTLPALPLPLRDSDRSNDTPRVAAGAVVIWGAIVLSLTTVTSPTGGIGSLQAAMGALRLRERCTAVQHNDDDVPPLGAPSDAIDNPTLLQLDGLGPDLAFAGGTLLGNTLLAAGIGAMTHVMATVVRPRLRTLRSVVHPRRARSATTVWCGRCKLLVVGALESFLSEERLPAALMAPFSLLLQPSITSATVLTAGGGSGAAVPLCLGLVGLLVWCAPLAVLCWQLGRMQPFPLRSRKVQRSKLSRDCEGVGLWTGRWQQVRDWLFRPAEEWRPTRGVPMDVVRRTTALYGVAFRPYRRGWRMYFAPDLGLVVVSGTVLGAASSVDDAAACDAAMWGGICLVLLATIQIVSVFAVQPFGVRFDAGTVGVVGALALAAECAAVAGDAKAANVLAVLGALVNICMLFTTAVLVVRGVVEREANIEPVDDRRLFVGGPLTQRRKPNDQTPSSLSVSRSVAPAMRAVSVPPPPPLSIAQREQLHHLLRLICDNRT